MQNLKNDKGGFVMDIVIWMVVAFVTAAFLGLWLYGHNLITTELMSSPSEIVTNATSQVVVPVNNALMQWVQWIAVAIIFGSAISIFISNFLIKAHPVFFFIYLLVTIITIMVSATISNRYVELISDPQFASSFAHLPVVNFTLTYLPYFVAVIGIFGAVFLFIGIIREKDTGVAI
tara:strand:+ start:6878 stop:7405 length:528 start_codon:yes stop_codon:yes gene_type:complete